MGWEALRKQMEVMKEQERKQFDEERSSKSGIEADYLARASTWFKPSLEDLARARAAGTLPLIFVGLRLVELLERIEAKLS